MWGFCFFLANGLRIELGIDSLNSSVLLPEEKTLKKTAVGCLAKMSISMDDFARLQTALMELKTAKYESDQKLKRADAGAGPGPRLDFCSLQHLSIFKKISRAGGLAQEV
jgi:hypothetical protein